MGKNKLKAILLVAGEGKRLRPFTIDRPKCMVEVDGISLIDRQLSILKMEGVDNIVMIGGYKAEMLKKEGIKLKLNNEYYKTNMLWTLFSAEEELEGDVIVSYGDIVYSRKILQALIKSTADIAITIDKEWENYWRARNDNPLDDAETLKLREDGTIIEIGKKPNSIDDIEGQYMGLMKFSARGVKDIKEVFYAAKKDISLLGGPIENAYMTDLLQASINMNKVVTSIPISDPWVEIDTVKDLNSSITSTRLNKIYHEQIW